MKLHRNDAMWDRDERKKLNENWDELEGLSRDFDNAVDKVSDEAFDKVVDSAKLDWATMVDEYSDLPADAEKGTTIGVKEDGMVYRFDGENWVEIYEINLNPIAEVDDRLSQQLAETVTHQQLDQTVRDKVDKVYVDDLFDSLGKLEVKGTYNSLNDLKNNHPNGSVGLFEVDGKLYAWNGTDWKSVFTLEVMPWAEFLTEQDEEWSE